MGFEQIQSGLQTILAFLVVLGITITIHEFGHFAVAKLLKIRVVVFSLGFGPRLLGFTRGGTEYRISAFPLGGYVKMAGETFDEDRQGSPDEFLSHPKWHRFLVAIAGPFMNIALAVVFDVDLLRPPVEAAMQQLRPTVVVVVQRPFGADDADDKAVGLQPAAVDHAGDAVGTLCVLQVHHRARLPATKPGVMKRRRTHVRLAEEVAKQV